MAESKYRSVKSSQQLFNFSVDQLNKGVPIDILSAFDDKLLISRCSLSLLYIYSREGLCLSTIKTNGNDKLWDATWTPQGNVVYAARHNAKVVVLSVNGTIIALHTHMKSPRYFSISNDDIIYLTEGETGVHQSKDDGVSWNLVFPLTDKDIFKQVVVITTDHKTDLLILEEKNYISILRMCSADRRADSVAWKDVNVMTADGKNLDLSFSTMSYDGNINIFLSDWFNQAIYVLSMNGQLHRQLLSSHHMDYKPCRLAVDRQRQRLYVGEYNTVVGVFSLIYEAGSN